MKLSKKKIAYAGLFILVIGIVFSGCKEAPSNTSIFYKDNEMGTHSPAEASETDNTTSVQAKEYNDVFVSVDEKVEYVFNIDQINSLTEMPTIEVKPHFLTESEVQQVAYTLFNDAAFFEARMYPDIAYSKTEIQERILRWSPFTNENAISELYGETDTRLIEKIKNAIEKYSSMYEVAPDNSTLIPADWSFKKDSLYYLEPGSVNQEDTSHDNDAIMLEVKSGQLQYIFNASTRNSWDYKLNSISTYLNPKGSPAQLDTRIYQSLLCRTEKPTPAQIEEVKLQAQTMLNEMNLGSWMIDQSYVETQYFGDIPEYIVHISAVPLLEGVPALRYPQLQNLKSEDTYASNYYLTDAVFEFSINGDLLSFRLSSPIDVTNVIDSNASLASIDTLISKAKEMFSLMDIYTFDTVGISNNINEAIKCSIQITNIDYGLSRIKVPDTDEYYHYVPSVRFSGTVSIYGEESRNTYYFSEESIPLLTLNATDGTILETIL